MKNQCVKKDSGNVNSDSGQMNTDSGDGAESWHFPPEYAFTQNQNQRSRSARMTGYARPEYANALASDSPIPIPMISRRPSELTAQAIITATLTTRPFLRTFT